jgi:hypothetical protein
LNFYSAKKVINIIKADLEANFQPGYPVKVKNFFGVMESEVAKKFLQTNAIAIQYSGADLAKLISRSATADMTINFFVVEQILATENKETYLIDEFRDFIFWKEFEGLKTAYPALDPQPFFPTTEALWDAYEGKIIWLVSGKINMIKRNIGG